MRKARNYHVSIANGLNFIDIVTLNLRIEHLVKGIEKVDNLQRRRCGRNLCKSDDVAEVDGDGVVSLGWYLSNHAKYTGPVFLCLNRAKPADAASVVLQRPWATFGKAVDHFFSFHASVLFASTPKWWQTSVIK